MLSDWHLPNFSTFALDIGRAVCYNRNFGEDIAMPIQLVCPNGHRLTANEANAGKSGKCPVCKAPVTIPIPNRTVADDSDIVVAVLGELNAQAVAKARQVGRTVLAPRRQTAAVKDSSESARTRTCPNCERDIDLGYHVCPHCHTYLTGLNEF